MNKTTLFAIPVLAVTLNACQFRQSVNMDLNTGAHSRGDGIGCDDVTIDINDKTENRNTFVFGERVNFIFNNVSGLTKEGDKVYPGLSMSIVLNDKDTMVHYADLLESMNEGTNVSPLQLNARFTSVLPFKNGEKYKVFIKLWDKKGEGTFTYDMPFTIEENKVLQIRPEGLSYSNAYLWDETTERIVVTKRTDSKHMYRIVFENMSGWNTTDGKIYPAFSWNFVDGEGYTTKLWEQFENEGISAENIEENPFTVTLSFPRGYLKNPYKLKATLADKNSSKRIDIEAELELE